MDELKVNTVQEREEYKIEIALPGRDIEDIAIDVTDTGFCIAIDDFSQCFLLSHAVNADGSRAAYDGETLYLEMPIRFPVHGKRMDIEKGCLDMGEGKHSCA